jgi:hypothetical protein
MLFQPNIVVNNNNNGTAAPATTQYIQSTPYDSKQTNYGLTADMKLGKFASLNASLEKEDVKRRFREREKTSENKVKLGYVNNGIENATVRVSVEHDNRTGSQYSTTQYRATQMSGALYPYLPVAPTAGVTTANGLPAAAYQSNAYYETRRIDVSDRKQNILNARFNYMVTPELDAGITGQLKRVTYPDAALGTSNRDQDSFNLDLTYQPSELLVLSGFLSHQVGKYNMASATNNIAAGTAAVPGVNPAGWATTCTDLNNPGGCAIPYNRLSRFDILTKDTSDVIGLDASYDFGKALLKGGVTSSKGVTATSYRYGSLAAAQVMAGGTTAGQAAFPDITFEQKTLDLNLSVPTTKKLTTKLMYHFEVAKVSDWHYTSVQNTPVAALTAVTAGVGGVSNGFVLDKGQQNYHIHAVGVMVDYKL